MSRPTADALQNLSSLSLSFPFLPFSSGQRSIGETVGLRMRQTTDREREKERVLSARTNVSKVGYNYVIHQHVQVVAAAAAATTSECTKVMRR